MDFELGALIIEFYGPTRQFRSALRYGIEGKWVECIPLTGPRPSRREVMAMIEEEDRRRTQ